jgi:hypothetical protein
VSSTNLRDAINSAAAQLNGEGGAHGQTGVRQKAPPGYRKIVVVYLEPASGGFHQKSREQLIEYFRRFPERLRLCGRRRVQSG